MREIKFRVWYKYWKQMFYLDDELNTGHKDLGEVSLKDTYSFEFMQYTGLKDKKGKEIYEGDIVEQNYEWTQNGRIINKERKRICQIIWEDDIGRLQISHIKGDITLPNFESMCITKNVEVIGNIYENSELLKGE